MNKLIIENISNAPPEYVDLFKKTCNELDKKLIHLITSHNIKIVLANKLSDVFSKENMAKINNYQDYISTDQDLTTRGLLSDTINALCVFFETTSVHNLEAIFYHEIGHLIDMHKNWEKPSYSNSPVFVDAYTIDISKHWKNIKKDNRYRLKHYIQNSTPQNISLNATMETFAHCFARINGKFDDIDILGEYFPKTLICAEKIYKNFLENYIIPI